MDDAETTKETTTGGRGDRAALEGAPDSGPGTALESVITVLAIALVGVVSAAVHAAAV